MAVLIAAPDRDLSVLLARIGELAPELDIRSLEQLSETTDIDFAVVWKHPAGLLRQLPGLKAISSLGAGAEHLLTDPELPPDLPVGRLAGARLAADMAAWLVARVIGHWRRFDQLRVQQNERRWQPLTPQSPPVVGLLGLGVMGTRTFQAFRSLDIPVAGYSRTGRGPDDLDIHFGPDGLKTLVSRSDYLICLLPLTQHTRGILNAELFKHMKTGSVLINVGRGEQLVEPDLIDALKTGRPGEAILDVFSTEPLPADHPFWNHPQIHISPHCASITHPREAAELIVASYRRVQAGKPPLGLVDRTRGY
jgi:glyoxylate/hydroxypyruvate reductase